MIVIFDPECVLIDTESCRFGSWERMALEQGIVLDKTFFNQFHDASDDKILQAILRGSHRSYSVPEKMALLTRRGDIFDEFLESAGDSILLPDTTELLQELRRYGYKMAAVAAPVLPGRLLGHTTVRRLIEFYSRMDIIPEQLEDICEKSGVPASECLVVTVSDYTAKEAEARGMHTELCERGMTWLRLWERLSEFIN